jgi:hypothetical protein
MSLGNGLIHDSSRKLTAAILDVFAPLIRDEEKREASAIIYEACRIAFTSYELASARLNKRLSPGTN